MGTKITISVTSNRGDNGSTATRRYRMDVENCYENLTVSAGNLVGHYPQGAGIQAPEWSERSAVLSDQRTGRGSWIALKPGSLVERASGNNYSDPIRFKKADGYQMPHISYTKKDGTKLQEDDDLKTGEDAFVQYLIKTETGFNRRLLSPELAGQQRRLLLFLREDKGFAGLIRMPLLHRALCWSISRRLRSNTGSTMYR